MPAAAVIRRVQALIGITGRKACAGGYIRQNVSNNTSNTITVQAAVTSKTLAEANKLNKTNNDNFAGGKGILDQFCDLSGSAEAISKIAALAGCAAAAIAFIVLTVAVVYMVYGAFIWLTDTEKGAERGRKIIFSSVIAMIVSVLAFAISALVTSTLVGTV